MAITLVMGNHDDMAIMGRNACLALHLAGHAPIPVVAGSTFPLVGQYEGERAKMIHGQNGIGDVEPPAGVDMTAVELGKGREASEFLVDMAKKVEGLTLVTLGPMTNTARAIQRDPEFASRLTQISLMGGTVGFPSGNKAPGAEANCCNDPEAAQMVFAAKGANITMAGLNVTHQLEMSEVRDAVKSVSDAGEFLYRVSQGYMDCLRSWGDNGPGAIGCHDPCAVMVLLDSSLFQARRGCVVVEVKGEYTRGATIADFTGRLGEAQTDVLLKVDAPRFYKELARLIAALPWKAPK